MDIFRVGIISVGAIALLTYLLKTIYELSFLKIEFKQLYFARILPWRWRELKLERIRSAKYYYTRGRGGVLRIKAESVSLLNEIEVPIWKEAEGYRAADYINDLVKDYWKGIVPGNLIHQQIPNKDASLTSQVK